MERPKFWSRRYLCIGPDNFSVRMESRVVQLVPEITVGLLELASDQSVALFAKIINSQDMNRLKSLNIKSNNLSSVPKDLLAKAVVRLKRIKLYYTRLTAAQVGTLFAKIVNSPDMNRLKSLNIKWNNLSSVPGDLLAKASRESLSKIQS